MLAASVQIRKRTRALQGHAVSTLKEHLSHGSGSAAGAAR